MKNRIKKALFRPETFLLALTILTAATMAWQHWGMNSVLAISTKQGFIARTQDDRADKGNSIATLKIDDAFNMHCQLNHTIKFPYCQLIIELQKEFQQGIDLTRFNELHITFKYRSSEHDTLRIFLKSMTQNNLQGSEQNTQVIGEQTITPLMKTNTYKLALTNFYVPSKWAFTSQLPSEAISPNLHNISYIVFTNGDNGNAINFDLAIERIEFTGKWINAEPLYQGLLWIWITLFLCYYGIRFFYLQIQDSKQKLITSELKSINDTLDARRKRLETIAIHDRLTGTLNRAGMRDKLVEAMDEKRKTNAPFSALLIDIESLQYIEEKNGVEMAEKILCNTVDIFQKYMSPSDALARREYSSFLMLCRNSTLQVALEIANNICSELTKVNSHDETNLSCNIGIAEMNESGIETLFEQIEIARQKAKRSGRNKAFCFENNTRIFHEQANNTQ